MIDTIIFDLDGTLLNTSADLTNAVNYALSKHNYEKKTIEKVKSSLGGGPVNLMERVSGLKSDDLEFEVLLADYLDFYSKNNNNETVPYDGINELLKDLKERNIKTAVLSNKQDPDTQVLVKEHFPDTFSMVLGTSDKVKKKPSTDGLELIIKTLNSKKENCLYVGDSAVDYKTACNAGIDYVLVTYGYRSKQQLVEAGAEVFIDEASELLKFI